MVKSNDNIDRIVSGYDLIETFCKQGIKAGEAKKHDYALDYLYKIEAELDEFWLAIEQQFNPYCE